MGNSGWTADPNTIVIPANAGGGPRIVITSAPPESLGYPLAAAILFYWNDTDYHYLGISDFGPDFGMLVRGFVSATTGLEDHYEEIGFSNNSLESTWTRYLGQYDLPPAVIATYFEIVGGGYIEQLADTYQLRYAPEGRYLINDLSDTSAAQEPGMTIRADSTGGNLGVFTTTEFVVASITADADLPWGFRNDSRYLINFVGRCQSTAAGDRIRFRIREDNATGVQLGEVGDVVTNVAGVGVPINGSALYVGRQLGGETVVLTGQRIAGAGNCTFSRIVAAAPDLGNYPQLDN